MMRKNMKWNWEERQQKVFEDLKQKFTIELVLATSDLDNKMRVEVEVSDFAMSKVLSMKCKDKKWRLVAYIWKSLNKTERNYKIYNQEMLMIIRSLEA